MSELEVFIAPLKQIVADAGRAILKVYHSADGIEVNSKNDDSPVTQADLAAHHIIVAGLKALGEQDAALNYPILSEEDGLPSFAERQSWTRYWLVDPLDGTKEFINKNGEFTVNIALIENGEAIFGMVYVPITDTYYYGLKGAGSFKHDPDGTTKLQVGRSRFDDSITLVGSRRHGAEAIEQLVTTLEQKFAGCELTSMGSSLKICAIAEGKADWYPRLALTSEWDTAAAHAVLSNAGGRILDADLNELRYNQKDDILNPYFHALGGAEFDWQALISEVLA